MDHRHGRRPVGYDRAVLRRSDNPLKKNPPGDFAGGLSLPVCPLSRAQYKSAMLKDSTGGLTARYPPAACETLRPSEAYFG
jgi:hypothetical protein